MLWERYATIAYRYCIYQNQCSTRPRLLKVFLHASSSTPAAIHHTSAHLSNSIPIYHFQFSIAIALILLPLPHTKLHESQKIESSTRGCPMCALKTRCWKPRLDLRTKDSHARVLMMTLDLPRENTALQYRRRYHLRVDLSRVSFARHRHHVRDSDEIVGPSPRDPGARQCSNLTYTARLRYCLYSCRGGTLTPTR